LLTPELKEVFSMSKDKSKHHNQKKKSKNGMMIFWIIIGLIVVIFLSQFLFDGGSPKTGNNNIDAFSPGVVSSDGQVSELDSFAQCLTESGAVFYGTEWCGHCANQKAMFGTSMQYINFVDCDENRAACQAAGVPGYPTWGIPGTDNLVGTQQFSSLAAATGCSL
jgi:hypothetical protein